jgi:hypothetical protein
MAPVERENAPLVTADEAMIAAVEGEDQGAAHAV